MSQSLAYIPVHLVFSTKNRTPFLRDAELREEMFASVLGSCATDATGVRSTKAKAAMMAVLGRVTRMSLLRWT